MLYVLVVVLVGFGLLAPTAATLLTDFWWFETVGYEDVFTKTLALQAGLGVFAGGLAFSMVYGSAAWAIRQTPRATVRVASELVDNPFGQALATQPPLRLAVLGSSVVALMAGMSAASWWDDVLLVFYGGDFGQRDPVFSLDASFYTFALPLVSEVSTSLIVLLVVAAGAAAAIYTTRGAIQVKVGEVEGQLVARGVEVLPSARRHLATFATLGLLVMAIGSFLNRYELLYDQTGLFAGPGYTELHATLPLLTIQAVATAIAAFLLHLAIERMSAGFAFIAGMCVIVPSMLASVVPGVMQRFNVDPNELNREAAQIKQHIDASRYAFGLDTVEERVLTGVGELTAQDIENNSGTIDNIRLWDHEPLLETFAQVQEIRTYYTFGSVDNDRYMIDGRLRQIMLAPRELVASNLPAQAATWVNQTMTYTHGHGMALGPVNLVTEQGLPHLFIKDLPPKVEFPDDLAIDRPEIYFGEANPLPVFVETNNPEFDYPAGDEPRYTEYLGEAGVDLGSMARLLFALRLGSTELLFSSDITADSRVLLYRRIQERVNRVAPFLRLDSDPYMVIADGRLVWVLDAYTVSRSYPYARRVKGVGSYIRNSVKVTVDAYDGEMHFYRFDQEDPVIGAWDAAFPGLLEAPEAIPESIASHLRYPQDLFDLQSRLFATYHMTDHQVFYNREDEWEVPKIGEQRMNPYYTIMRLPGEETEEFILMLPFTPATKDNLTAWMVARADGEHMGKLRVYKFPKEKLVYGPSQIVARINQEDSISEKLSLWDQQGSKVTLGTLLVIPVEESLLYVQPLYLRAQSGSIPELKRVIVAYEDRISMQQTLEECLEELFGLTAEPPVMEEQADGSVIERPAASSTWRRAADAASDHWSSLQSAAAAHDWVAWGEAMEALGVSLEDLERLSQVVEETSEDAEEFEEDGEAVEEAP